MRWLLLLMVATSGCARMVVHKDPGPNDVGVRFYRPKPYLFLGPAAPAEKSSSDKDGGGKPAYYGGPTGNGGAPTSEMEQHVANIDKAVGKIEEQLTKDKPATMQAVMKIEFLPDYSEEYSIRMTPGVGQADLNVSLQNGWNLTSVGAKSDQRYAEILGSIAQLAGAAAKGGVPAMYNNEGHGSPVVAEPDVPLGYYEAVLAMNECGRRELIGWRYVGFMPYLTCPVKACVVRGQICCSSDQLFALVFDGSTLKMKRFCPSNGQAGACTPFFEDNAPRSEFLPGPTGQRPAHSRSASGASPRKN